MLVFRNKQLKLQNNIKPNKIMLQILVFSNVYQLFTKIS